MRVTDQEDLEKWYKLIEHLYCVLAQVHNIWIIRIVDCICDAVADLGGFQGFHGTPLLASVMIEGYGSLAFNKTQLAN